MKQHKAIGRIESLGYHESEITVLKKLGQIEYIIDYRGKKYNALFSCLVNRFYVDDLRRRALQC